MDNGGYPPQLQCDIWVIHPVVFEKEELDSYNSPEPVPSKVYMERTLEKSFGLMSIINRNQVLVEKIMDHQTVILKAGETICDSPRRRSVMDSGRHPTDYPRRLGGMDSGRRPTDYPRRPVGMDPGRRPTEMIQRESKSRFKTACELGLKL